MKDVLLTARLWGKEKTGGGRQVRHVMHPPQILEMSEASMKPKPTYSKVSRIRPSAPAKTGSGHLGICSTEEFDIH